jgi:hypothetical protein
MAFWQKHGMEQTQYLHEVSWALELLTDGEHKGLLTLSWLR